MTKTHFPITSGTKFGSELQFYFDPQNTTGNVFYVNSATGTDSTSFGFTPEGPFASLSFALSQCTANNGDVVYLMAGHAETLTAATSLAVAGVTVIGLPLQWTPDFPVGNRPTFTFTTATSAVLSLDAAGITLYGLVFKCNIASQTAMLKVTAVDCLVDTCDFRDGGQQPVSVISVNPSGSNGADRFAVRNSYVSFPNSGATNGILINKVTDRLVLENNRIWGDFSTAAIQNPSATVCTNMQLYNNEVTNLHSAVQAINLVSASTGTAYYNSFFGTALGSITLMGALNCAGNLENTNAGTNDAVPTPAASSVNNMVGAVVGLKKTITSSTITTSAQALTTNATGDVYIENIVLKTDSTGLAGATNFRILSNNAKGALPIVEETVANLGASKTVDAFTASVVKQRTMLESGKQLQFLGTASAGTGAGTVDVYILYRRLSAGASIS